MLNYFYFQYLYFVSCKSYLSCEQMNDLEGVFNDPNGHQFLCIVTTVHHEWVCEPLYDRTLSLAESLGGVSTGRVRQILSILLLHGNVVLLKKQRKIKPLKSLSSHQLNTSLKWKLGLNYIQWVVSMLRGYYQTSHKNVVLANPPNYCSTSYKPSEQQELRAIKCARLLRWKEFKYHRNVYIWLSCKKHEYLENVSSLNS